MVRCAARWLCVVFCGGCQYVSGVADLEIDPAPEWKCLGSSTRPTASGTIEYDGPVRNLANDQPLDSVVVRLCRSEDDSCEDPISTTEAIDGSVRFSVDAAFDGYVLLESPDMLPAIVELSRPIGAMRVLPELQMVPPIGLLFYAAQLDASIDAELGHVLYWTLDCAGQRAKNVSVEALGELPPNSLGYYVVDTKFPVVTVGETDESGAGGFINLPTTFVTFEARRAENGAFISRFAARVRTGHTTLLVVEPD